MKSIVGTYTEQAWRDEIARREELKAELVIEREYKEYQVGMQSKLDAQAGNARIAADEARDEAHSVEAEVDRAEGTLYAWKSEAGIRKEAAKTATRQAELAATAAWCFHQATIEDTSEAWANAREAMQMSRLAAGAEDEADWGHGRVCPECGSEDVFCTSYCNHAHCVECGAAVDPEHNECWLPPLAIRLEREGHIEESRIVLERSHRWQ